MPEAHGKTVAWAVGSWRSGGCAPPQLMPEAALSSGQPRQAASRFGHAGRPIADIGLVFDSQSDRVIELARVTSRDVVCDLGFGDAQFLLHVAASTGCRCIGCEVNGDLVAQAAAKVAAAGEVGSRVSLSQAHPSPNPS